MLFNVLPARARVPRTETNKVYLLSDKWNDKFEWNTQYDLVFVDEDQNQINVGSVKIGEFGMVGTREHENRPNIPKSFDSLDESFFSIGQSEYYYETLNALGPGVRDEILKALRDVAYDDSILPKALHEPVMKLSLLREVPLQTIRGRFRRLARGDVRSTRFKFSYKTPNLFNSGVESPTLTFDVIPYSEPPTNIHVLIGRNGVGKTYYLTRMTRALVNKRSQKRQVGVFSADESNADEGLFANVISVAFSAFDPFESLPTPRPNALGLEYSYVGLRQVDPLSGDWSEGPKDITTLTLEFLSSVKDISAMDGGIKRWRRALKILESDPVFEDYDISALADDPSSKAWLSRGRELFKNLSSGHKIVLLTITRLIAQVTERTLVLIDEPESHLHPPLLSALIRSLSDLLIQQNGVAIIATHSPVVLQEVPKSCVWKLRRNGEYSNAERPDLETFGENVGVLTREVFGLEVTESGFHKMLQDAATEHRSYERVLEHFGGQLGEEARAILRAKIATSK